MKTLEQITDGLKRLQSQSANKDTRNLAGYALAYLELGDHYQAIRYLECIKTARIFARSCIDSLESA